MEVLLAEMTTPVQNPAQELAYSEYIRRINDMTFKANTDFLDIEADYKNDIDAAELDDFRTSITNIEHKTSATYADLCTWRASNAKAPVRTSPPPNQTSGDVRIVQDKKAYRQKEATEKARSIHTHIELDYNALKQEVTQHGNYLTVEDHVITKGMKMREP